MGEPQGNRRPMTRTAMANHPNLPDALQYKKEENPGFRADAAGKRTGNARNVALRRNSRIIEIRTGPSAKKAAHEADKTLHQVS